MSKDIASLRGMIEDRLIQSTQGQAPGTLYDPIVYTFSHGGKRMRPSLVLLATKLFGGDAEDALGAAVSVEIFHNFTLLHDDIMDKAPLRRGHETVHVKWDENTAILSGDTMMIMAYQELINTPDRVLKPVLECFNQTAKEVCEGQQFDMDFETRDDVTVEEYLGMIKLKTSVLLAASLKVGALIGGASEEAAQRMYGFGLNIGIAFQLQDDLLDAFGDSAEVGKQSGGDIIANKKTYLMLTAMEEAGDAKSQLVDLLSETDHEKKVREVTNIFEDLGIDEITQQEIDKYYRKGLDSIEGLELDAHWKGQLMALVTKLMGRRS
ncbi:MAG: geranylgeranyl diphosphate synthase type II [Bacteroidia bacterium]|jgi:geranylgeranyl diphosphate synthase type II